MCEDIKCFEIKLLAFILHFFCLSVMLHLLADHQQHFSKKKNLKEICIDLFKNTYKLVQLWNINKLKIFVLYMNIL